MTYSMVRLHYTSVTFRRDLLDSYRKQAPKPPNTPNTPNTTPQTRLETTLECDSPLEIWRVHSFMSEAEVEYVIEAYTHLLHVCTLPSMENFLGQDCSELTFNIFKENDELLWKINERMDAIVTDRFLVKKPNDDDEGPEFQIRHYREGVGFPAHRDRLDQCAMPLTFMVYLNDLPDGAGGETIFPQCRHDGKRGKKLTPRKGDLVIWSTCHPSRYGDLNPGSDHIAAPIKRAGSEKFILNKFYTVEEVSLRSCVNGLFKGISNVLQSGVGVTFEL